MITIHKCIYIFLQKLKITKIENLGHLVNLEWLGKYAWLAGCWTTVCAGFLSRFEELLHQNRHDCRALLAPGWAISSVYSPAFDDLTIPFCWYNSDFSLMFNSLSLQICRSTTSRWLRALRTCTNSPIWRYSTIKYRRSKGWRVNDPHYRLQRVYGCEEQKWIRGCHCIAH